MIKFLRFVLTIFLLMCNTVSCSDNDGKTVRAANALYAAGAGQDIYGGIDAAKYLSGMFDPKNHPAFVCINDLGIDTDGRRHYLRREAAQALKQMIAAFHAEHPNVRIWVQSSTRTFDDQKRIWNNKFNGVTRVGGKKLNEAYPDHYARALKILEFSSMPGTSRHHWGSDFDINILTNSYYETGDGAIILEWLEKNASRFGYYRPYTAGRENGYAEERWHWSYVPVSVQFLRLWVELYNSGAISISQKGLFGGSEAAGKLAPLYVLSVAPACR